MPTNTAYYKTSLVGGGTSALDGINGAILNNNDFAFVMISDIIYAYQLNATSGADESSPDVISPDTNAGDKRWILQNTYTENVLTKVSSTTVAFDAVAATTLYTVPTGKLFIPVMAIVRAGADAGKTDATFGRVGALTDWLDTIALTFVNTFSV